MTSISRCGYARSLASFRKINSFYSERNVLSAPRLLDLAARCSRKVQDNISTDTSFPSVQASGPSEPLVTGHHP